MKTFVSKSEFARMEGVTPQAVNGWIKSGRIDVEANGKIDPEKARRQREASESPLPHHQARKAQFDAARTDADTNPAEKTPQIGDFAVLPALIDSATPLAGADVSAALKLETWKLQKAKAEQANLELDKMAGALVERAEVDFVLADFGNTLRSMFEGMADRMSGSVARHRGDVNAIHKEIDDTAHDMLQEMAELMKRKMDGLNA